MRSTRLRRRLVLRSMLSFPFCSCGHTCPSEHSSDCCTALAWGSSSPLVRCRYICGRIRGDNCRRACTRPWINILSRRRVIFSIIMQESTGNVGIETTYNNDGHGTAGLMQCDGSPGYPGQHGLSQVYVSRQVSSQPEANVAFLQRTKSPVWSWQERSTSRTTSSSMAAQTMRRRFSRR